jgi:selenide,water dikinase
VRDLPKSADQRLIVGAEGFSDAAVFEVASDLLLVQSVDFFAPLVDDPFVFGQIAAANSLSDIFAMGATPITALNIVCFPDDKLGYDVLNEILRGGTDKVHEGGGSVVGGHSIRDNEIKYGLSVTGLVSRAQLMTNQNAQPGDVLVLTKKLGTGFITTAMKKNKCSDESVQEALDGMARLNKEASAAARECGARSATDITGYGLAVHACEMAQASDVSLEIELERLAILPDALELSKQGFLTRANKTNRDFCISLLRVESKADEARLELVFDPQTSGGLLISIPEAKAQALVDRINGHASNIAEVVGTVHQKAAHSLRIL